jgi:hypothetical protein
MTQRAQRSARERHAHCRLAQVITELPWRRGFLVERARPCGKPTCRCRPGQRHRSLDLALGHRRQRALLYIPRPLQETVRQWLHNGRRRRELLQTLKQQQLEQLLQRKQQLSEQRLKTKTARLDRSPG